MRICQRVAGPANGGAGSPVIGCSYGFYFAIEAKAKDELPTKRPLGTIEDMTNARGVVFVIDGPGGLEVLEHWLTAIERVSI